MSVTSMRWMPRLVGAAVLIAAAVLFVVTPAKAIGTTYYVDAVGGTDAAAGTSPATAWQSLAKINATTFGPGDSILLRAGQTWAGQLAPKGSGSLTGGPIRISSYGIGARPKIDGGGLAAGGGCVEATAVLFQNQEFWTVDGLEVVNNSGTDNFGSLAVKGNHRSGICFINNSNRTLAGFTVVNNYVHDVNGCFECNGYSAHMNGGIVFAANDPVGGSSFDDVLVQGNTISYVGRVGIVLGDWSTPFGFTHYYVGHESLSTRVTMRGNELDHLDSDGIVIKGTEGALVEHNVVAHAAQRSVPGSTTVSSGGIWCSYAIDTVFQYNEVYGTKTQTTDGQGFDVDAGSVNTKVQYNYSHDNEGGFLLLMGLGVGEAPSPSKNLIVRYNLSVNDAFPGLKGVFQFSYGVPDKTEIQNNTIYIPAGSPAKPMNCDGCDGASPGDWRFRNNIIENHGSGEYNYINTAGAVFDHNLYFGNHPVSEPPEPGKLTSDPKLVAPGGPPSGYQLQSTSPAIGAGTVIQQNGGVDYFGNVLSATAAPSLGFHEGATIAGPATLMDDGRDFLPSAWHTANITIDSSNPPNFGGDTARFVRTDVIPSFVRTHCAYAKPYTIVPALTDPVYDACHGIATPDMLPAPITGTVDGLLDASPGAIAWRFDGMQSFDATLYVRDAGLSGVTFWASSDGRTYAPVTITNTTPVPTAGGWAVTTITPSATLPSGTTYVMARLAPTPSWAAQIGRMTITR